MNQSPKPNYEELADTELMALVKSGDKDAFSLIVQRHQQPLMNFFRRLGVYSEVEDLVQDTFVRLFKYRAKYKPTAKFTTFLYMMARQIRIDLLRKHNRHREIRDELREESMNRVTTGDTASRHAAVLDARAALVELPEMMRNVVVLNMYHGLRYNDIAEVLDIPVGTVKSRMFNALRKLREILDVD